MALVLSSANIFTLVYFEGNERGLVCLSCCTADVTLNAITIHWVTSRGVSQDETGHQKPSGGGGGGGMYRGHGNGHGNGGGYVAHYSMSLSEKQVGPVESHITVEAYVDEFHASTYFNNNNNNSNSSSGGSSGVANRVII